VAQKVQVVLVDDLDGGEAEETVSFALDGVSYEIDLSSPNAAKMRDAFAAYVGSARRVGGRASSGRGGARRTSPAKSSGGSSSSGGRTAEIREWARNNGHKVNERGRIPASIVEEYEKAHG
jgi:hypothetical protein